MQSNLRIDLKLALTPLDTRLSAAKVEGLSPIQTDLLASRRIAWLFPSLELGQYWQPVFRCFTQTCPQTRIFTGWWDGFLPGLAHTFSLQVVGKIRYFVFNQDQGNYVDRIGYLSPRVLGPLLRWKPHIIFVSGFSLWSILVIALKPLLRWKIILLFEGWSPSHDYRDSAIRMVLRRWMVRRMDAAATNHYKGEAYLVQVLGIDPDRVFTHPYEVPDLEILTQTQSNGLNYHLQHSHVLQFLFVGRLIPRKGLHLLLQACALLHQRGYENYRLQVIGQGPNEAEFRHLADEFGIHNQVEWIGWVNYDQLGTYFSQTDVFVFPTLEDTWGMVLLEAMAFGKPVLCSCWAGSAEMMVQDGENGFQCDPQQPEILASLMAKFLDHPDWVDSMGKASYQKIAAHSPAAATRFLLSVAQYVLQ
jgi:glycosyltransferase involved in cell wall biosynthesis